MNKYIFGTKDTLYNDNQNAYRLYVITKKITGIKLFRLEMLFYGSVQRKKEGAVLMDCLQYFGLPHDDNDIKLWLTVATEKSE
jgi:hypothetical protein